MAYGRAGEQIGLGGFPIHCQWMISGAAPRWALAILLILDNIWIHFFSLDDHSFPTSLIWHRIGTFILFPLFFMQWWWWWLPWWGPNYSPVYHMWEKWNWNINNTVWTLKLSILFALSRLFSPCKVVSTENLNDHLYKRFAQRFALTYLTFV